jgi:lipid A 4'-phosphatase
MRLRDTWEILLFLALAAIFITHPELDLAFSSLFYQADQGFVLGNEAWVQIIHNGIPLVARWLGGILAAILVLGLLPWCRKLAGLRKPTVFLLLSFAVGNGLLVNTVLKDHWGRARPADVQAFGGSKIFTPAFVISDQCSKNCSFVSGHAAQGFFFTLAGIYARRWFWFVPGLALGSLVGLARIVQGRHFLSDIIFAFFAIYFVGKLLRRLMFSSTSRTQPDEPDVRLGTFWLRMFQWPKQMAAAIRR